MLIINVRALRPDLATVDALARLQLAALRRGVRLRLSHASAELVDLVAFLGLDGVLPAADVGYGLHKEVNGCP